MTDEKKQKMKEYQKEYQKEYRKTLLTSAINCTFHSPLFL